MLRERLLDLQQVASCSCNFNNHQLGALPQRVCCAALCDEPKAIPIVTQTRCCRCAQIAASTFRVISEVLQQGRCGGVLYGRTRYCRPSYR